jgi:hypothetical protein
MPKLWVGREAELRRSAGSTRVLKSAIKKRRSTRMDIETELQSSTLCALICAAISDRPFGCRG